MKRKINRHRVGELPLMEAVVKRLNLREILDSFLPPRKNEEMPASHALILLIYNLAVEKAPLYELQEWVSSLDLGCVGYEKYLGVNFTDDRFGRCLDKLYSADRAALLTAIVISAVKAFNIDLSQIHNDSTSVKAFGKYPQPASSGFELKFGKSKDHRPDLKQLVYSLSISADGGVPVHCKAYSGNRNDDTTHIETWETIRKIRGKPDFLYVADCKLCTDKQLLHVEQNGGRALTTIPNHFTEVVSFKTLLRTKSLKKKEIWRRELSDGVIDYISVFNGTYKSNQRGYTIHWIHSSNKKKGDHAFREEQLKKAESKLSLIPPKINKRNLKSKESIEEACNDVLSKYKVAKFITITIGQGHEQCSAKRSTGRPKKGSKPPIEVRKIYTLSWSRNADSLKQEERLDGVFPLLSTDPNLSAKDAITAFKYQPRLEKRFTQLKSIHQIAPLLCKKVERIEANMFLFFIALLIQALIERQVRSGMQNNRIDSLEVYPENREAVHPTTSKVFDLFSQVSTYTLTEGSDVIERHSDELTSTQQSILDLLSINEKTYWGIQNVTLANQKI